MYIPNVLINCYGIKLRKSFNSNSTKRDTERNMCLGHFSVLLSNCLMFCNFTILHNFMYLYLLYHFSDNLFLTKRCIAFIKEELEGMLTWNMSSKVKSSNICYFHIYMSFPYIYVS